jgi:hypothetical protein
MSPYISPRLFRFEFANEGVEEPDFGFQMLKVPDSRTLRGPSLQCVLHRLEQDDDASRRTFHRIWYTLRGR